MLSEDRSGSGPQSHFASAANGLEAEHSPVITPGFLLPIPRTRHDQKYPDGVNKAGIIRMTIVLKLAASFTKAERTVHGNGHMKLGTPTTACPSSRSTPCAVRSTPTSTQPQDRFSLGGPPISGWVVAFHAVCCRARSVVCQYHDDFLSSCQKQGATGQIKGANAVLPNTKNVTLHPEGFNSLLKVYLWLPIIV
ncbi:hypothetical protein BXT84_02040 [Sulfobacillus thermotolerans]|uniref:Uncharacterized protein n=1 Tax=Sulfobacillus thermotolerans TaxID=338644 RepID=A0ABM6RND6_9FIRM|nr:hypothetical protein BXT84_02040 [Sulfobacillus thermotolerans]